MGDVSLFRVFNIVVGAIGLALGIGLVLVPKAIEGLEKSLDKEISTEALQKLLEQRRNLTAILLKRNKISGVLLLLTSLFLLLASVVLY